MISTVIEELSPLCNDFSEPLHESRMLVTTDFGELVGDVVNIERG